MSGLTGAIDIISDDLAALLAAHLVRDGLGAGAAALVPSQCGAPLRDSVSVADPLSSLPAELREQLASRGYLTEVSHDQERATVCEIAQALHELQRHSPSFLLVPSFDCNYRCTYCFERPLQNELLRKQSGGVSSGFVMTPELVESAFSSIQRIQEEAGCKGGGQVILYGGEPLDARNKDIVYRIVSAGRARGFTFAAISNGHDLQHFLPLIGLDGIRQVQVSIDGPRDTHDRRRVHILGESSFDRVLAGLRHALETRGFELQVRVHLDLDNVESFAGLLEIFSSEGWLNRDLITIYVSTVYSKNRGSVAPQISNRELAEQLRRMCCGYKNVIVNAPAVHARAAIAPSLATGAPYRLKSTYCAANAGQYIFAPDGYVYCCWESVGTECSKIGCYADGGDLRLNPAQVQKWFQRSSATIHECLNCPYALLCGGGCAQYAEYATKDHYRAYCNDFQYDFQSALTTSVEECLNSIELDPMQQASVPRA